MGLQGFAGRVESKYGAQLSRMFGGQAMPQFTFQWGSEPGDAGYHHGANIFVDRNYWNANPQQRAGLLIHEMADQLGVQRRGGGADRDPVSDAARYALTGTSNGTWNPSQESAGIANRRGWNNMGTNPGGNGHRAGDQGNNRPRNRNTVGNGGMPATQSPSQEIATGEAMGNASYLYAQKMAAQRIIIANARAGLLQANQQARSAEIGNMASTVENQIGAGGLGSSSDVKARSGLLSQLTAQRVANQGAEVNTIQGAKSMQMQAQNEMLQSQYAILAERNANMLMAAQTAFNNGSTIYPNSPVNNGGNGNGPPPPGAPGNNWAPTQGFLFNRMAGGY